MPEENEVDEGNEANVGIITQGKNMLTNVKTPVFWLAMGFVLCKFLDRKRGKS